MIVVIPQTVSLSNCDLGEAGLLEWLPPSCPRCAADAIIGHGRRIRQAHDAHHAVIRIRRGLCKLCQLTLTVLPAWCLPYTHYTLPARAAALDQVAEGKTLEQAAPPTQDPNRVADPATLRRWVQRRLVSGWACTTLVHAVGSLAAAMLSPTIFAWDWPAASRMLTPEAEPT
jgi:hypothetical protein